MLTPVATQKMGTLMFEFDPTDRPLVLQVAATVDEAQDVITMVKNPMFHGHIDAVDLNCGCPQGFAQKRGIGAFLARQPDAFVSLVREIAAGIAPLPLSVKLRLHESVETTIDLLRRLVEAGAQCVTLHGRYAYQKGEARGRCGREGGDGVRRSRQLMSTGLPALARQV